VDFAEGYGLKRTFGRHSFYASVTTAGAGLGQAFAAGGPLAVVCGLESLARQAVFPVAGLKQPERDLELPYVVAAEEQKLDCILVTSLGVGGTNASLLLRR
jgi:3-oxoacyl-(acyl-carrier-protein) synthase